ncbi:MAG: hypothetical protein ACPL7M_02010, partial [Bryobacteraceae bacterium]
AVLRLSGQWLELTGSILEPHQAAARAAQPGQPFGVNGEHRGGAAERVSESRAGGSGNQERPLFRLGHSRPGSAEADRFAAPSAWGQRHRQGYNANQTTR